MRRSSPRVLYLKPHVRLSSLVCLRYGKRVESSADRRCWPAVPPRHKDSGAGLWTTVVLVVVVVLVRQRSLKRVRDRQQPPPLSTVLCVHLPLCPEWRRPLDRPLPWTAARTPSGCAWPGKGTCRRREIGQKRITLQHEVRETTTCTHNQRLSAIMHLKAAVTCAPF